jgi:hypothetical protein
MMKKWIPNYININILKNNILEEAFIKKKRKNKVRRCWTWQASPAHLTLFVRAHVTRSFFRYHVIRPNLFFFKKTNISHLILPKKIKA